MKRFVAMVCAALLCISAYAGIFTKNLTESERAQLDGGQFIIKKIPSLKKLSIAETDNTARVIAEMKKLNPSYITEIIMVKPYTGNESLLEKLDAAITDVPGYTNIPYFSERNQKLYQLYESAVIEKMTEGEHSRTLSVSLKMSGFEPYKAETYIERTATTYFCKMKNSSVLRYRDKFDAVSNEKMNAEITVFRDGGNWVIYVLSGISAPRIMFVKDRAETSFANRMKSFCEYIAQQL